LAKQVYVHNFTGYQAQTIQLPCSSEADFEKQLNASASGAAKDCCALPRGNVNPGDCADVYVIKDYRAYDVHNAHYTFRDHEGLVDEEEWTRAFPRHHRAVADAGRISQHFRTLVISQATSGAETQLLDLRLARVTAATKAPRTSSKRSRNLYFLLAFLCGLLIPFIRKRAQVWLSPYLLR